MSLYFFIAAFLGVWVFALILANERRTLVRKMEHKAAEKSSESPIGD